MVNTMKFELKMKIKLLKELMTIYSYRYSTRNCFGELIDELMKYPDMTIRDFFEMYAPEEEDEN